MILDPLNQDKFFSNFFEIFLKLDSILFFLVSDRFILNVFSFSFLPLVEKKLNTTHRIRNSRHVFFEVLLQNDC